LADDPMQLEREVDWVIKQRVIQAYMEKNRLSWRDPKVSLMDLQYHDIRPDKAVLEPRPPRARGPHHRR
jgi:proteasome accessory factor A